ncbi:MAG: ATP-dependent endonuclease, partial [Nitrospiria bacterium]
APFVVCVIGKKNSGKTTLLQAVMIWNMAMRFWLDKRGPGSGSKAKKRTGVPISRKDFTAIPLREMNLLWNNTSTGLRKDELGKGQKLGQPRVLSITLQGNNGNKSWESTFEFRYTSSEQVTIRPAGKDDSSVPLIARDLRVVHVPPFSGIGAEETGYDLPYQNLLIGQGKAGDILRNLILEVYKKSGENRENNLWEELCRHIREIFRFDLLPPQYAGKPYILCEYLPGIPRQGHGRGGLCALDIASAGSGFHQVLLLLAFFYARPATVLLLDEPDAHLHVILQKQIYDLLRRIASERGCQLIIATHSEVLIDGTSPDQILSFYRAPHLLLDSTERDRVREAIKRLTSIDILLAEEAGAVLYLEGEKDFNLLRAWAKILKHPLYEWLTQNPFWHSNQGRNPAEAKGHLFALRALRKDLKGILLLDGDNRERKDRELMVDGLTILRWNRYESENYLIHPEMLLRFISKRIGPLFTDSAKKYLEDEMPPAAYRSPLIDHDYLVNTPASKTLLPGFFASASMKLRKAEYYLIAEQMRPNEIHSEVVDKLDAIAQALGIEK